LASSGDRPQGFGPCAVSALRSRTVRRAGARCDIKIPDSFPTAGDVRGLRVAVTGASRGLGRIIAAAFIKAGSRVALISRSQDALDAVVEECGGESITVAADISTPEGNVTAVDAITSAWGGLDVWIANAGISPTVGGPCEIPVEIWRDVLATNLDGVFYGIRAAVPALRSSGRGRIIITGSVVGERPRKGLGAYSASKAAVHALAKSFAQDLAPDITVNVVAPGWFDSPMAEGFKQNEYLEERILGHTALRRWGQPGDLPGAYLFLASEAAAFMTGTVVSVDGGYLTV
jgi:NAD(P)-dependent dehydrogenase (short-subunit alcohol dehydrogenase family)